MTPTPGDWIIYLRQSDFRGDDPGALTARADELHELAAKIGVNVPPENVRIENDVDPVTGRIRGASASKATRRVTTANGLVELRTRRPVFDALMLDLQRGAGAGLLVSDESRIARDHRDGMMLLDACRIGGASCVALDEETGGERWVLTKGGTRAERDRFQDRIEDARRFVADLRAKIVKGRRRWAGQSWHGGRRPFGFQIAEGTEEHARNLVKDEAEAAELVQAAQRLLAGVSLRWCIADLRERDVPTVTGAPWSTRSLRDALMKPATAGLQVKGKGGPHVKAPWPEILDRPTWERLRALLTDPARRTNAGLKNEPRHLVSLIATCGVCGGKLRVGGAGRGRGQAYVGQECGHVRRDLGKVDHVVEAAVLDLLERPAVLERLRPPPRPGVDFAGLTAELAKLDGEAARHRAAEPRRAAPWRGSRTRCSTASGSTRT